MTDQQTEPLMATAQGETVLNMRSSDSEANKKGFKIAGLTMLACLLIAGQALTAYLVLSQKSRLGGIEQSNEALKKQLQSRPSGSDTGAKMQAPMHNMARMMHDDDGKHQAMIPLEDSTGPTMCQMQASGQIMVMDNYRPQCDENGDYTPRQCNGGRCWCVTKDGIPIPGSMRTGEVECGGIRRPSGMAALSYKEDPEAN